MSKCTLYRPSNHWSEGPSRCIYCGLFGHTREQIIEGSKFLDPAFTSLRWRIFYWFGNALFSKYSKYGKSYGRT